MIVLNLGILGGMMNKFKQYTFLLCIQFIFLISCNANERDLDKIFRRFKENLVMVNYEKGNYTATKNEEYLVLYRNETKGELADLLFSKGFIVVLDGNKITKSIELDVMSFPYQVKHKKIIEKSNNNGLNYNDFPQIYDFNNNGIDEILFFGLSGMSFSVSILEYSNSEESISNKLVFSTYYKMLSEVSYDSKSNTFTLLGWGNPEHGDGNRDWYKYQWNDKTNIYEVIKQGYEND